MAASFKPLFDWLKVNSPKLYAEWSVTSRAKICDRINEVTGLGLIGHESVRDTIPKVIAALKVVKALGRI